MDATRQKLIETAGQLFSRDGFESTTVREICQHAGTNVASIHYHFGDKERLYIEAVKHAHCHQPPSPQPWAEGATPPQKLAAIIHQMMTVMLDAETPSWHTELMMRELARPTSACEALVREFIDPLFAQLLCVVTELLPPSVPLVERQGLAFSVVAQCLLYRYHRPIGRLLVGENHFQQLTTIEESARRITEFSLGGLQSVATREGAVASKPGESS